MTCRLKMTFGSGVSIKVAVIKDTICNIYSSAMNDNIFRSLSYFIRDLNEYRHRLPHYIILSLYNQRN